MPDCFNKKNSQEEEEDDTKIKFSLAACLDDCFFLKISQDYLNIAVV
jgi:hypothetical protein